MRTIRTKATPKWIRISRNQCESARLLGSEISMGADCIIYDDMYVIQ
jgi:hypothetical protein